MANTVKENEKKVSKANKALETARAAMDIAKSNPSAGDIGAANAMRSTIELAKNITEMKALDLSNRTMEKMIKDEENTSEQQIKKPMVSKEDQPGIVQLIKALDPETQREVMQKLIGDNPSELYELLGPKKSGVLGMASPRQMQQPTSPASELKTLAEAIGITADNRTNNETSSMNNMLTMLQIMKELRPDPVPQPVATPVANPQNDAMLALLAKMGDAIMESNKQTREMIVSMQSKLTTPTENSTADKYLQMAMEAQKAVDAEKDKRHAEQLQNILDRQAERDAMYQKQLENINQVSKAGLDNRGSFQQMMEEFRKMKEMGQTIGGETNVEIEKAKIAKETQVELAKIELDKLKLSAEQSKNEAAQRKAARSAWEGAAGKVIDTLIDLQQTKSEPAPVTPLAKNILGSRSTA